MRYIIDASPGLAIGIKVLEADGENSILNQTCNAFPCTMLLLCVENVEENIKQNLPETISENKRNNIFKENIWNTLTQGLGRL